MASPNYRLFPDNWTYRARLDGRFERRSRMQAGAEISSRCDLLRQGQSVICDPLQTTLYSGTHWPVWGACERERDEVTKRRVRQVTRYAVRRDRPPSPGCSVLDSAVRESRCF